MMSASFGTEIASIRGAVGEITVGRQRNADGQTAFLLYIYRLASFTCPIVQVQLHELNSYNKMLVSALSTACMNSYTMHTTVMYLHNLACILRNKMFRGKVV